MTATTLEHVKPIIQTSNAARFGAEIAFIAEYHFLPRRWAGLGSEVSVGGWLGWVALAGLVVFNVAINRKQKAGSK